MAKSDSEAQRKSSLSDCTWLENEFRSFNLESLKFLMHFREPGSSFYSYSYSHFFLFLIYIFSFSLYSFFSFFSFFLYLIFFFFFFLIKFFYLLPLNSKIILYVPSPPCLDVCSSSSKEVIEIR
jgi:hypothetical protein